MGKHRMFSQDITRSDAFLEMPTSSRLLYYDLNQEADDEGFVSNPKTVIRMTGASLDDMNVLIAKKFVIVPDESKGIVVIKHWWIHNYIRKDRLTETNYKDIKSMLELDDNGCYTMNVNQLSTSCQPSDNQMSAQDKLSKDKLSKVKKKEDKKKYGEYQHVELTDTERAKLETEYGNIFAEELIRYLDEYIEMKKYKAYNHYLCIKRWVVEAVERDGKKRSISNVKPQTDIKVDYQKHENSELSEESANELEKFLKTRGGKKWTKKQ